MFPSPNCFNPFDPSFKRLSSSSFDHHHQNPSSSKQQDHDPPFLFTFPSPFLDEHEQLPLNQILSHNNHLLMPPNHNHAHSTDNTTTNPINKGNINGKQAIPPSRTRRNLGAIPRRRTGKKDRHSKICTAQGIRDRRMRLSLQVARKFFDLQDMLGYDKASQTIEWLFNQSNKAIKDLAQQHPQAYNNIIMISTTSTDAKSESFLSECEVVSGLEEISNNNDVKESIVPPPNLKDEGKGALKPPCKMRESRDKARARARCRTREKMMIKRLECRVQKWCGKSNPSDDDDEDDNLEKLRSSLMSNPFEGHVDDQESNVNPFIGTICCSSDHQVLADVGTIEKLLGHSSSSTTFDHYSAIPTYVDPMMGFLGSNWEVLNNVERANSINYGVANAGNPNSIFSASYTAKFP